MIKILTFTPDKEYYGYRLDVYAQKEICGDPILETRVINEDTGEVVKKRTFIKVPSNIDDCDKLNWKLQHARNYFINKKDAEQYNLYGPLRKTWTNKDYIIKMFLARNLYDKDNELWRAKLWYTLDK